MKLVLFLLSFLTFPFAIFAQSKVRAAQFNIGANEPAISGYDPVSYFANDEPVKGKSQFSFVYEGIKYQFASATNLETFKKQPSKYEPQYGGWCAYAMGHDGTKVEVDPETYKIIDGKLYLFYNRFFTNTLKSWNKDESSLKKRADANWPKFYHP